MTETVDAAPGRGAETAKGNYVDGVWRAGGGEAIRSWNPTTGELLFETPAASGENILEAVGSARAAAEGWAGTSPLERSELLLEAAALLEQRREAITDLVVREVGKPRGEAREEVSRSVSIVRYHALAALDPHGVTMPSPAGPGFVFTARDPLGVVGLIMPWNFPAAIPLWKIAPALAYGNTVVVKAAPHAGMTACAIGELFAHLPAGVFNLVQGGAVAGQDLVRAPVDGLSFTGSTSVGTAVAELAVRRGLRFQGELGGKNASVVLADADIERAVDVIAGAATGFAGQKCTATSRVIVDRAVIDSFRELLVARIGALRVGDPGEAATEVGPLIDADAVERVEGFVRRAVDAGAEVLVGGERLPAIGANFYSPALVQGASSSSEIVQTEIFGPVVTLASAEDADDALALANDSIYGLAAAVFTRDLDLGLRFSRRLAAGIIRINGPTPGVVFSAPFGPLKASGIGLPEQGKAAQQFFTSERTVSVA